MAAPRSCPFFAGHLRLLLLLVGLVSTAWGAQKHVHDGSFTPDAVLRVSAQNISMGGIYRYSTLINGTAPGPALRIPEGQVAWIRVYNDMTDQNTTIHWHGLAQAASPFSDGTPLASQWPIPPQHFFDYELQLPNGTAGTYFYHGHVGFQAVSAAGSLIVEDAAEPPYETDGERTVFLHGLWNRTDTEIEEMVNANPLNWPGETQGIMINGMTISNYGIVDPASAGLAVIPVEPNSTYRMRFIGGTALSYTAVGFEDHDELQVIEADGSYTRPAPTHIMQVGGGQRFSALLQTKTCEELEDLDRLDFYVQTETRERTTVVTNYAILSYSDACGAEGYGGSGNSTAGRRLPTDSYPTERPVDLPPTINGFLDYELRPLQANDFPSAAEVTRRVVVNVQAFEDGYVAWQDSNVSWSDLPLGEHVVPEAPYLVALYLNETQYLPDWDAAVANGGVDPRTKTFPARIGEVLEIVFQNYGADSRTGAQDGLIDAHPFHVHGGHVYDAGSGPGAWSAETMEAQLEGTEPVQRDTTMLFRYRETAGASERSGWRAWRLRVEDPGVWMVHCHWLQHMLQGMQTVWVFGDARDVLSLPRPEVEGYLTFGGDVYGNATHDPAVIHFSE